MNGLLSVTVCVHACNYTPICSEPKVEIYTDEDGRILLAVFVLENWKCSSCAYTCIHVEGKVVPVYVASSQITNLVLPACDGVAIYSWTYVTQKGQVRSMLAICIKYKARSNQNSLSYGGTNLTTKFCKNVKKDLFWRAYCKFMPLIGLRKFLKIHNLEFWISCTTK